MNLKLGVLTAAAALAFPASAFAHGSVYQSVAKVGADRTDEIRYVITNHGFTLILTEDNGLTGAKGMIAYNLIPSAWRTGKTKTEILATGGTGAQPHATCTGVPALEAEAAILGWQGTDPFYNYVPFQSTSAGLEDVPATWLPTLTAAGFDVTKLGDAVAAKAECEKLPGATYVRADETATSAASLAAGTVGPLAKEIDTLSGANATLTTTLAGVQAELAAAKNEIAGLLFAAKPMTLALSGGKLKAGAAATVSGPPLRAVTVTLSISAAEAKRLKLASTVVGKQTATTSAAGSATVAVKLNAAAAKAVKRLKRSLAVTAEARSGDRFASTKSTLAK